MKKWKVLLDERLRWEKLPKLLETFSYNNIYFLEEDKRSNGGTIPEPTNLTILGEIIKI